MTRRGKGKQHADGGNVMGAWPGPADSVHTFVQGPHMIEKLQQHAGLGLLGEGPHILGPGNRQEEQPYPNARARSIDITLELRF
eukprot:3272379-Pyramimonas_sp.AAC.1